MKIRKGAKEDLTYVLELIKDLAEYENSLEQVSITIEDLKNDGFGVHPYYWFIVAEKENEIIGLSFYWIRYSTWKGKILFLEDFIVKKEYRRQGVGTLLFEQTVKVCKELNLNPLGLISSGSLIITCEPKNTSKLIELISNSGINVSKIGKMTKNNQGLKIEHDNITKNFPKFERDEIARYFESQ